MVTTRQTLCNYTFITFPVSSLHTATSTRVANCLKFSQTAWNLSAPSKKPKLAFLDSTLSGKYKISVAFCCIINKICLFLQFSRDKQRHQQVQGPRRPDTLRQTDAPAPTHYGVVDITKQTMNETGWHPQTSKT